MTEMDPQFRHDLISGLNTLYGILFADTQGWEPIHPSVREQLSIIAERLAAIIPDEDRILKNNWRTVAPARLPDTQLGWQSSMSEKTRRA
jgi:hypothetical protein